MNAAFYLPWPDKKLSPNARGHWATEARAKKKYRADAAWTCRAHHVGKIHADAVHVKVTFFPPDNRQRDLDNMIASLKSAFDGISDVIGINDSKWTLSASKASPVAKQGMVKIELEWSDREAKAA